MIYFVGCSYTWGAGLQFEYLSKERGWTSDEINAINPPKSHLEHLDHIQDVVLPQLRMLIIFKN